MGQDTFLGAVASAYADNYEDLSEFCFIFPNKRAGTFFLNSLRERIGGRVILAPEVATSGEFVTAMCGRVPAPRLDLIFRLYDIYCRLLKGESGFAKDRDALEFDRFAPWAEVLLLDFNEVERYHADASKLFHNVKEYQEISANFLTPDQIDVLERYFGYSPSMGSVDRFWKSLKIEEEPLSQLRGRFVRLWQLLPELYNRLLEDLEKEGLCLEGSAYRIAADMALEMEEPLKGFRRIVAVGFNALSTSEQMLFESLAGIKDADGNPYMEFFWDATGPVLGDASTGPGREMARYMRNFPQPEWAEPWLSKATRHELPSNITVEAAPSNSSQVKLAGAALDRFAAGSSEEAFKNARTAVVVPDESLMLPLLYSLPQSVTGVNLTMGYSMKYTAVASFIHHLRSLYSRMRTAHGETGFYHEDLRVFLSHPLVHLVIGSRAANDITAHIDKYHRYVLTPEEIGKISLKCELLLSAPKDDATPQDVAAYLDAVLVKIDDALKGEQNSGVLRPVIERSQILLYRNALQQLMACVERYGVNMKASSVFRLADRLIAGETIAFEGEPLEGLQILGMLETRCLDFENLIILSANDKVLPSRARKRTFIPDALRVGYGLPLAAEAENLYAYYFWRLLSRAGNVDIIYDARAGEGMRSGGQSRFLLQLDLLYAPGRVKHSNYSFTLNAQDAQPESVVKSDYVISRLNEFTLEREGRNLSASSLKKYAECPVKFYYESVVGINDDPAPTDGVDAITLGNIVHNVMLNVYVPKALQRKFLKKPIEINREFIDDLLERRGKLRRLVIRAINKEHFHLDNDNLDRELSGASVIVADRVEEQIRDILRYDRTLTPFSIAGGEISGSARMEITPGFTINMRYAFDRVDICRGKWRIVDYKTGDAGVEAVSLEDLFVGKSSSKNMMQLLIYADLLEDRIMKEMGKVPNDIGLSIYSVNEFRSKKGDCVPVIEGKEILSHRECIDEFREKFKSMILEIFDASEPFRASVDPDHCRYCRLSALCGSGG